MILSMECSTLKFGWFGRVVSGAERLPRVLLSCLESCRGATDTVTLREGRVCGGFPKVKVRREHLHFIFFVLTQ